MTTHLTPKQIELFDEQGFLTPLPALSRAEAQRYRSELEALEERVGAPEALVLRTDLHLLTHWAWELVRDPRIVDPVSDLLGPNVLLWSLQWFIKEPRDGKYVSYHQDAAYWGLEPHDVVTAWVAATTGASVWCCATARPT